MKYFRWLMALGLLAAAVYAYLNPSTPGAAFIVVGGIFGACYLAFGRG